MPESQHPVDLLGRPAVGVDRNPLAVELCKTALWIEAIVDYDTVPAVAAALVVANMNSIPLDWAARFSVSGVNMNFFIVKQLPVLPPEAYLGEVCSGRTYVELLVPRVLELT